LSDIAGQDINPPQLKNPTEQLPPPRTHEDPPSVESSVPTSPETAALLFGMQRGSRYAKSHPLPAMIFKFWQFFVDYVNPLIKVIHAPTMQREILKAMDNLQEVDKPLEALLFSIYTIVVASVSTTDCLSMFACERAPLLAQFRTATQQALVDADFLRTTDFQVLQALLLFMVCALFLDDFIAVTLTFASCVTLTPRKASFYPQLA
jgi:hypothetical protein